MQKGYCTTEFYVDMIYRLQMKRIAAGYTQEELSFLLGYPPDQISKVEAFNSEALVFLTDLNRFALIFHCDLLTLVPGCDISHQKIEIQTRYYKDSNRNYYLVYKKDAKEQTETLYKIIEDKPGFVYQSKDREAIKVKLQVFVKQLITDGYFDSGAEAWDIYKASWNQVKKRYSPQLLKEVLNNYVSGDQAQLTVKQEENRITYYTKALNYHHGLNIY